MFIYIYKYIYIYIIYIYIYTYILIKKFLPGNYFCDWNIFIPDNHSVNVLRI